MSKVISLRPELDDVFMKAQRKFDSLDLFDINYGDITRQAVEVPDGAIADYVVYGPQADMQMRRMLSYFRIDELPLTYCGMRGVVLYCKMLHGMLLGGRDGSLAEDVRRHALRLMREHFPLDYDAAEAFFDEDWDRLGQVHRSQQPSLVSRLEAEYREQYLDKEGKPKLLE